MRPQRRPQRWLLMLLMWKRRTDRLQVRRASSVSQPTSMASAGTDITYGQGSCRASCDKAQKQENAHLRKVKMRPCKKIVSFRAAPWTGSGILTHSHDFTSFHTISHDFTRFHTLSHDFTRFHIFCAGCVFRNRSLVLFSLGT